jgi:hypothetical protein
MQKRVKSALVSIVMVFLLAACSVGAPAPDSAGTAQREISDSNKTKTPNEAPNAEYKISYRYADVFRNASGSVMIRAIVGITNTGSKNLYLSFGSFDYLDATGELIDSEDYIIAYPNIIQPGETSYMYAEHDFYGDPIEGVTVVPTEIVEEAILDCQRLPVSQTSIQYDISSGVKIKGRVENNTDSVASFVYVCAVMKNASGFPICIAITTINKIEPTEKLDFEMTTLAIRDSMTSNPIASFDVFAFPMQVQF